MYGSNNDAIDALVSQKVITELDGFDYTDDQYESMFNYVFHFASENLLASMNTGDAMPVTFFIHSSPNFHAVSNSEKLYIAISKGLVERLNYAIPEDCAVPAELNGIDKITDKDLRTVLLEICGAFVFYHEKAHIMHKIRPVDILDSIQVEEIAKTVEEFDEDIAAVDAIFSDSLSQFNGIENAELLATILLTALNLFFVTMAHSFDELKEPLKPPVHLRYASCLLQVFVCFANKGVKFTNTDYERIIRNAEKSCKQITSGYLKDNIDSLSAILKHTTNLQNELQTFAGESSRFPLLDVSILTNIK